MATGPEHYRQSEAYGREAESHLADGNMEAVRIYTELAAWRATLALAAAQGTSVSGAQLETDPAVVYVYRAEWGPVQLGTYTISDAAREHCEADALNNSPEFEGGIFEWLGDESDPDAPYELVVAKNGGEDATDYTVTRISVATEYDPEADA